MGLFLKAHGSEHPKNRFEAWFFVNLFQAFADIA
jgi:hypothetical protein